MSRKTTYDNYRVEVYPDLRWLSRAKEIELSEKMCREIEADVKRHIDNVHDVYVTNDAHQVCEHCGAEWTEDSTNYNGGCCDKDQEAEEARELTAKG